MRRPRFQRSSSPLSSLFTAAWHVWWKVQLFAVGVLHMLFSSDKQWPRLTEEASGSLSSSRVSSWDGSNDVRKQKRIIFVRHAESEWNVVFNRGVLWRAVVNFFRAVVREWLMLPTSDSIFLDSPLSRRGHLQAQNLQEQVCETSLRLRGSADSDSLNEEITGFSARRDHQHAPHASPDRALLRHLCCPMPNSVVVASNLRRAIDTARIASASRLEVPGEKIHVLSSLQEIGRNIDTLALSDAYKIESPALLQSWRGEKRHDELFNVTENHGNKAVLGSGRDRMLRFAQWVFKQPQEVVVVYGHSLWFRSFCQEFFPDEVYHEAKSIKLHNCGVASFLLEKRGGGGSDKTQFVIQPDSFQHLL